MLRGSPTPCRRPYRRRAKRLHVARHAIRAPRRRLSQRKLI